MPDSTIELSVVIAAHGAAAVIDECLRALERQQPKRRMEIIVADSSADGTERIIRERHPTVRLLHFSTPLMLAELRGRAIALAAGRVIAILDPYSVAAPDWAHEVLEAHERHPNLVIGGVVDLHRASEQGWLAWSIYLNEYGLFMPPCVAGPVTIVPGSNVSYKRTVLFDGAAPRQATFWKTFINWSAEEGGSLLWLEPRIRVSLNKPIPFRDFLATRYLHGRCFAAMRVADRGWCVRLLRAASTPLLPPLQIMRWTRGFWPKRRRRAIYLLSLPLQLGLFTMWAWGEFWGYIRGDGGTCRRLFY
jgi:glycosyltransferase involved in cell wall biosynthesis